jgi:cell division protein FtsI (penicillin-binding protein 3)
VHPHAHSQSTRRVQILARIAFAWAAVILLRLVHLQVVDHPEYARLALLQHQKRVEVQAPRGALLDRAGRRLAMSLPVESVCVNPLRIPDVELAADLLSGILNVDRTDLVEKLKRKKAGEQPRGFLRVKRKVTREEAQKLRSLNLGWVEFRRESKRVYPNDFLAAHLIGGVDHEENGNGGLELAFNKDLVGKDGLRLVRADVRRNEFDSDEVESATPGKDIVLTIDEQIQYVAERELKSAIQSTHCTTGSVVAMDPRNGDILAMASYPTFNPNETLQPGADLSPRLNRAISAPFEPGSVFKVVTVSGVLEKTSLRPESILSCGNGRLVLAGRVIRDHHSYGSLPLQYVLAKSSNIGTINAALRMGDENLLEYVKRFGFGRKTDIGLPAEESGLVRPLRRWGKSSIGSVAMGHEISTTTLQLAQACSVIANGGFLIRPRIVLRKQRGGEVENAAPIQPVPVLKPQTAFTMRQMMRRVVLMGTGRAAAVDGYSVAGKTGSAQIFDFEHRVYTHKYNASFMGFSPIANPSLVVVVTLNGSSQFGGAVAAPVFRAIASAALRHLGVPNDIPDDEPEPPAPGDVNDLAIAALSNPEPPEQPAFQPVMMGPQPPPGILAERRQPKGRRVPDFQGLTLRDVVETSSAAGVPVQLVGRGVARLQAPPPGAILGPGERVRVQFAR